MLEALFSGDSLSRVLLEHLADQVLRGRGDSIPVCWVEGKGLFEHVSENLLVVVSLKWWVSTEEHEEDDTETPDVTGFVVVALEDFWGNVVRCSNNCVHALDSLLLRKTFREAEVNELHLRLIGSVIHQEVLWLEVSVDDAMTVQVLNRRKHLTHDVSSLML